MAASSGRPEETRSAWCSATCCASSSRMSDSRAGSTSSGTRRARTSAFQSGMADPRDAVQRREERVPAAALRIERRPTVDGQPIETPPPCASLLDPPAVNQPAVFEAVERGVERRDVERERAVRSVVDEARDFVPGAIPLLHPRENHDLRAALEQ